MIYMEAGSANFRDLKHELGKRLLMDGVPVNMREWQSQRDLDDHPMAVAIELQNVSIEVPINTELLNWKHNISPNLPWAEDHFEERVSGIPLNPPPSSEWWPFAQKNNEEHKKQERFSHTYPERFWPKLAGSYPRKAHIRRGIRFDYGDLGEVVGLLVKSPLTRQAYLPVWFPEDTGDNHGERVPCTLGYHFLMRQNKLYVTYYMRSCDFLRHFADDVYMAGRLGQWVRDRYNEATGEAVEMGNLLMHMSSFHVFQNDLPIMDMRYGK